MKIGKQATSKAPTKNSYAVNVLKRVKSKLDGKEGNFDRKLSVEEQVNDISM